MFWKRRVIIGSVVALLCGGVAFAFQGVPINKESLRGRWEAIDDDEPRVFVLSINDNNDSVVTMTCGLPGHFMTDIYRSTSLTVRNGAFVLEATGDHGRLVVRGHGQTLNDAGNMDGEIALHLPPTSRDPSVFHVHYAKRPGGYANLLKEMIDLSDRAAASNKCDGGTRSYSP